MNHPRLLRGLAALSVIAVAAACTGTAAPTPPAATSTPGTPQASGGGAASDAPLSQEQIAEALKAEGQVVGLKSWGFGGLDQSTFPDQFRAYTEETFGVPVELVWDSTNGVLQQAEQAGRLPSELGIDVIDSEEDKLPKLKELGWIEPIDAPQYENVLQNYHKVEDTYLYDDGLSVIYQGFEWMGVLARKDLVDVNAITSWTDLAKPEYKGKIVLYGFEGDTRGPIILMGVVNALLEEGVIQGDLWSEETVLEGLKWWKENLEPNVLKYVDTGEIRTMMQSGEAAIAVTWGAYIREIQGAEWNLRDDVIAPIYFESSLPAVRSELRIAKGTPHPVTARVLLDWMLGRDFQMVGWYKDPETGAEENRWDMTEAEFLGAYTGGVIAEDRELMPDWAKPYYPDDPAKYTLPLDFEFVAAQTEWIQDQYKQLP